MTIRAHIYVRCSSCDRETEATGIARMDVSPFGGDMKYRAVQFPRQPITGAGSEWYFDEATQEARCPEHAKEKT